MTSSSMLFLVVLKLLFSACFVFFPSSMSNSVCSNFLELGKHVFLTKFGSLSQETLKGGHFLTMSFFPTSFVTMTLPVTATSASSSSSNHYRSVHGNEFTNTCLPG